MPQAPTAFSDAPPVMESPEEAKKKKRGQMGGMLQELGQSLAQPQEDMPLQELQGIVQRPFAIPQMPQQSLAGQYNRLRMGM